MHVADLPDGYLGAAPLYGTAIAIDDDAAGYGWFVDPTPADDAEFGPAAGRGTSAAGRMDLLTVVMHELGHILGLDSHFDGDSANLMYAYVGTGTRRAPLPAGAGGFAAPTPAGAPVAVEQESVGLSRPPIAAASPADDDWPAWLWVAAPRKRKSALPDWLANATPAELG